MLLLGSEKTQRLTLYKDAIGVTNLFFSNTGDVPLAWNLAVTANSESLLWVLSSTSGTLSSGIMQQVAISLDLTALQARAKEYRTELTLNTSSPTPTPVPISATTGVVISTVVSASPDAMRSNVTIKNVSTIAASSAVEFAVLPVDSTGLAILDASQIAYTAQLRAPESTVIACSVAYDAASDSHRGTCTPPSLIAGEFAIDVLDAVGSLVGNQSHAFYISACPETYFLDPEDSVCKCVAGSFDHGSYCDLCPGGTIAEMAGKDTCTECPIRRTSGPDRTRCECEEGYFLENEECVLCPDKVTCAWNSTVADWVLDPGVWRLNPVSKDLRDCRFGDASCPGVTASDDGCTARGFGGWPHCGCGYAGPTCAVCAPNYFLSWAGNSCQECGSSDSHTPSIVLGCVLVVVGGLAAAVVRTIKAKESFSWVAPLKALSRLGRTKASILFYVCQVRLEHLVLRSNVSLYFLPKKVNVRLSLSASGYLGVCFDLERHGRQRTPRARRNICRCSRRVQRGVSSVRSDVVYRQRHNGFLLEDVHAGACRTGRHLCALVMAAKLHRPGQAVRTSGRGSGEALADGIGSDHTLRGNQRHAGAHIEFSTPCPVTSLIATPLSLTHRPSPARNSTTSGSSARNSRSPATVRPGGRNGPSLPAC